jgi:hypothetical protein
MQWLRIRRPAEWREQPVLPENHDLAERLGEELARVAAAEAEADEERRRLLSDGQSQLFQSGYDNETD